MSVFDDINDFFSGVTDSYAKIEKELERTIISTVMAPAKKLARDNVKLSKQGKIVSEGQVAKENLTSISSQLDTSMKGSFSKKVSETIEHKKKEYTKW